VIGALLNAGLNLVRTGLGNPTCTYKGADYACMPNVLEQGTAIEIGGKLAEVRFRLFIPKSVLATAPAAGEFLTYAGMKYKILPVASDPSGAYWRLDLQDIDR
jgi:hypothetical protein